MLNQETKSKEERNRNQFIKISQYIKYLIAIIFWIIIRKFIS